MFKVLGIIIGLLGAASGFYWGSLMPETLGLFEACILSLATGYIGGQIGAMLFFWE
jgi:hypothetical protein